MVGETLQGRQLQASVQLPAVREVAPTEIVETTEVGAPLPVAQHTEPVIEESSTKVEGPLRTVSYSATLMTSKPYSVAPVMAVQTAVPLMTVQDGTIMAAPAGHEMPITSNVVMIAPEPASTAA